MRQKFLLLGLLCWLSSGSAYQVKGLYTVAVPVDSDAHGAWVAAVRTGLSQVLVKVSGNTNVASIETIEECLSGAENLVQRFEYLRDQGEDHHLELQVTYEQSAVDRLLRQAGQAQWRADRPAVMVWLVIDQPGQPTQVVGSGDPRVASLMATAKRRGVPVFLPLMDLHEATQVTATRINASSLPLLAQLSQRYEASSLLVGRIQMPANGGSLFATWLWQDARNQLQWSAEQPSLDALLTAAVDHVADDLVAHYAVLQDEAMDAPVTVEVTGAAGVQDYAGVLKYLRQLVGVSQVDVVKVAEDRLTARVLMQGGVSGLAQALVHSKRLQVDLLAATAAARVDMVYRWYAA